MAWWFGWLLSWGVHAPGLAAAEGVRGEGGRPDPAVVRAEVQEILRDPRFAPRKTLWQWLGEWFTNWKAPNVHLPEGLTRALLWILLIWCLLALAAILTHLIWTLSLFFRGGTSPRRAVGGGAWAERFAHHSLEELTAIMQQLASRGEFREALGVMMVALLKGLERAGAVRFHESKTNGEYVLEYPQERAEREEFRSFVNSFEGMAYGGRECGAGGYERMHERFTRICSHVEQRPQV